MTFYDQHPFDWTAGYSIAELQATLAPPLAEFIGSISPGATVLDVGCGPGRVTSCIAARGLGAIGVDMSSASVRLMRQRTGKPGVVASCLELPFHPESVDAVIADGVVHHAENPFAAFAECCRVLKSDGRFYLAVYKPGGRYQKLYRFPGAAIRWAIGRRGGATLVHLTLLPLFYAVHLLKSRGRRTWSGAKNLFYDYFVSPRVEFISRDAVGEWGKRCEVEIVKYDPNPTLNVHSFILRKLNGRQI